MNPLSILTGVFHPHEPQFVALSVVLAVFASYVALETAGRIRMSGGAARTAWTVLSGVALGAGVWLTHFIAIIGLELPVQVTVDTGMTVLSFFMAATAATGGIAIAFGYERSKAARVAGGLFTGFGAAALHYLGMAALEIPVDVTYNWGLVALSAVIAVVAAATALHLVLKVHSLRQRIVSAFVMGFAVVAVHFTGMAAVTITGDCTQLIPLYSDPGVSNSIAGPIVGGSMLMLLIGLALVHHDRTMRRWNLVSLAQFGIAAISSNDAFDRVLTRAAATTREALGADMVFIGEIDDNWCRILGADSLPEGAEVPPYFAIDGRAQLFAAAISACAPVQQDHDDNTPLPNFLARLNMVSGAVVPVPACDGKLGVVCAFFRRPHILSADDIAFVNNLGGVLDVLRSREAAIAGVARKVVQQTALADFSISAFAGHDGPEQVEAAVKMAREVLGAGMAAVLHTFPAQDRLVVVGSNMWPADYPPEHALSSIAPNGLIPTLSRSETAVRFSDITQESRFILDGKHRPGGIVSGMGVPVKAFDNSQILFVVFCDRVRTFTHEEEDFLRTLANITALVIERSHAREMLDRKMRKQMALTRFSTAGLRSDNLADLFRDAADIMRTAMHMDFSAIFEIDEKQDLITRATLSGWSFPVPADYSLKAQSPRLYTNALLAADGPLIVTDMDTETRFDPSPLHQAFGIKSGIGLAVKAANGRTLAIAASSTLVRTEFKDAAEFMRTLGNILVSIYDRDHARESLLLRDRALDSISQGIVITDETTAHKPIIYANPAFTRMVEHTTKDVVGQSWLAFLAPDAPAGLPEALSLIRARKRRGNLETRLRRRSGTSFSDRVRLSPIVNADGDLTHYVAVHEDVTDEQVRDQQLQDAQKMEAVGQLTGGIAHDFNNLLTVVKANAEDLSGDLAKSGNDKGAALQRQCGMILKAADRGADLVRQLMAFARKQELEPQVVDLNSLLEGFSSLVRRTLPAHIAMDVRKADALPPVKVDPGRLENAVLNLVINARDAMPADGSITIETGTAVLDSNYARENPGVRPGPYAVIAISDTGSGMSKEVMEKAFQPFFTTKEVGQGTGLGLSMVYGFARQSGGHAEIQSEVDQGTTVRIFLPPAEIKAANAPLAAAAPLAAKPTAGSVLVVEDNDLVRETVCERLQRMGFTVRSASSADAAVAELESDAGVDLVFSDVIMPGAMTGADLAREVQRRWPAIHVLLTSGYTEASALGKVKLPEGIRLLSKPYSNAALSEAIRTVMDKAQAA